jgi:hypothetical protein
VSHVVIAAVVVKQVASVLTNTVVDVVIVVDYRKTE